MQRWWYVHHTSFLSYATATPVKNCIGPEQGETEYSLSDFIAPEPHFSLCSSIDICVQRHSALQNAFSPLQQIAKGRKLVISSSKRRKKFGSFDHKIFLE